MSIKLSFGEKHRSIENLESIELPDFTVLTGVNGSGKTHFLEAIRDGKIVVDGIAPASVIFFDYGSFRLDVENICNGSEIAKAKKTIWNHFVSGDGEGIQSKIRVAREKNLDVDYKKLVQRAEELEKGLFDLTREEVGEEDLFTRVENYKKEVITAVRPNLKKRPDAKNLAILALAKLTTVSIDQLSEDEFIQACRPYAFKGDFLPLQLSRVFWDYYLQLQTNETREFQNEKHGKTYAVLSEREFQQRHGKKPWILIREILNTFNGLDYEINSPEGKDSYGEFELRLVNSISRAEISFADLSSGERTLMTLAASIFKSASDKYFPDLLLLDEIDASLHPSMTENMLEVIQEVFIQNRMKVILVTHSPSTVALAPDDSLYLINKETNKRLIRTTKEEALQVLTDGFVSLSQDESNLSISSSLGRTSKENVLFTEGITDKIIIETAWKKLHPDEDMPFWVQDAFDASFLRNLFSRGDDAQDGIFVTYPRRKHIALFDFDRAGFQEWNALRKKFTDDCESNPKKGLSIKHNNKDAVAMLLPVPENVLQSQVIKNGVETYRESSHLPIELLFYGVEDLSSFYIEQSYSGGGKVIEFNGDKKRFIERIKSLDAEQFGNFRQLFDSLHTIFNS